MSQKLLEKVYDPVRVEEKWYHFWEENKLFHADAGTTLPAYTIMIPPPNVTGMLTMGHILNNTIQDLLIRWKRMSGYETLWMPGTDHAGIATQNKVEAALKDEGLNRHMLGREKFLQRVWEWREKYGGIILKQLRKLGAACDWDRECFTMDAKLSQAVREVFVRLYEKGLVYKGRKLINWCPECHTALSDEEVNHSDDLGGFWNIAYPLKDGSGEIVVATTRPETMLGDSAVAVHPADPRYQALIGKTVILPLIQREIPIIADEHADPALGSGAVKITPAHDFNDFEVGLRHELELVTVIDLNGKMTEKAGAYQGMDRFEAREKILQDLKSAGLLRDEQKKIIPTPRCYRSDDIIEPYLSEQWFVKMKPLAEPALQAVRDGKIRFYPKYWEGTYFHWMENIKDWCISRQIWWGHRIPAWYCENNHMTVARTDPDRCAVCGSDRLHQDTDVLDTWFSSWLWPFSTLGWPADTNDLKKFFPTQTLVTGPDIIFFWVARMIMASLEFMGDIPFSDVYFNGMIRDLQGRKMSKSLGNSPDPLWLINGEGKEQVSEFSKNNPTYADGVPPYGADAVRMTMVFLTPVGGDVQFDHTLVEMGQKFCNKLWNAARFVLMNVEEDFNSTLDMVDSAELELADRWILSRLHRTIQGTNDALAEFKLNDATQNLYGFVWSEFCDWYLELVKMRLYDESDARRRQVTQIIALHVLDSIVRLLHPFMPFITEEIWQSLPVVFHGARQPRTIFLQPYPESDRKYIDDDCEKKMARLQSIIGAVRNIRGEMNVPPAKQADLIVNTRDHDIIELIEQNEPALKKLAQIARIAFHQQRPKRTAIAVVQGIELYVPLEDLIDMDVEKRRLDKEISRLEAQLVSLNHKLVNSDFIARAPAEVVEKERKKKQDFEQILNKLVENRHILTTE
jgi:valyl-tRNA synthetase